MDNSVNRERCDDHRQSLFQNGCGYSPMITITITPTTGGQFNLEMVKHDTIENLKRIISKKLKVSRERICLLHRERQLKEGTLEENEVIDGSRLTLLPTVETGLTAQKPELSVMNALESLNEAQVNDFLSGKAPLNLTMRLGDHMMLIQLMLSTFSNQNHGSSSSSSSSRSKSTTEEGSKSIPTAAAAAASAAPVASAATSTSANTTVAAEESTSSASESAKSAKESSVLYTASTSTRLEKILSSALASASASGTLAANCISSKPANAQHSRHHHHHHQHHHHHHHHHQHQHQRREIDRDDSQNGAATPTTASSDEALTTASNSRLAPNVSAVEPPRTSEFAKTEECKKSTTDGPQDGSECSCASCPRLPTPATTSTTSTPGTSTTTPTTTASCALDSVALSEATRNLTQTLKKLSSEVLTSKRAISVPQKYKGLRSNVMHYKRKPNAIIENMEHHGRGIYSGTFSGTLNPALQDRHGRPKKDVSTIIHILNDLLCAGPRPHCRKSSCPCNNGGASTSSAASTSSSMMVDSPSTSAFDTANNEQTNSTVQVPATCTSASAKPPPNEIVDPVSKSNENQTTRNKMKQLKTIMEERKEKRKAKRFSPYEKQFSCVDLITSQNMDSSESWPGTTSDSSTSSIHPTKANESIEPDPSPSIHSEPVIA